MYFGLVGCSATLSFDRCLFFPTNCSWNKNVNWSHLVSFACSVFDFIIRIMSSQIDWKINKQTSICVYANVYIMNSTWPKSRKIESDYGKYTLTRNSIENQPKRTEIGLYHLQIANRYPAILEDLRLEPNSYIHSTTVQFRGKLRFDMHTFAWLYYDSRWVCDYVVCNIDTLQ